MKFFKILQASSPTNPGYFHRVYLNKVLLYPTVMWSTLKRQLNLLMQYPVCFLPAE